jgi:tRNA(Ile)-lysidine synthase
MSHSSTADRDRWPVIVRGNLARLGGLGRGVVAVSGGADSVALLRALAERTSDLVIAHLNHQLRGADSDGDAAFVAQLCPSLPHRTETLDVAALAKSTGDNLEAVARRARYEFLGRVARETKASWVATAHTLDDQAETVLHRLIRGTGLRGLRGIAAKRELAPGIMLLRPMLTVSRAEVIAYLQEIGQDWREDVTNRDVAFTRNRIRHELLPLLREFNPQIAEALARVAEQADDVFEKIEADVASLLETALLPPAGKIVILEAGRLAGEPDFLVRELLNRIWETECWPRSGMTSEHWQRAADVALGRASAWDLPAGIRIVSTPRVIRIGPSAEFPA